MWTKRGIEPRDPGSKKPSSIWVAWIGCYYGRQRDRERQTDREEESVRQRNRET